MSLLKEEFDKGLKSAFDSSNLQAIKSGGKAVTNLESYWFHSVCSKCGHTFRVGDEVEITQDNKVLHSSNAISDALSDGSFDEKKSQEKTLFLDGLENACPVPDKIKITRITHDHPFMRHYKLGFQRSKCIVCGHTIRCYDFVVICPCNSFNPKCMIAIHYDPFHSLMCFDYWHSTINKNGICSASSRTIHE